MTRREWEQFRMDSYLEPAADADKRCIPENPKQIWGFDADDVLANLSLTPQGRAGWTSTLKLEREGLVENEIHNFLSTNHVKVADVLQQLLAPQDPLSVYLNAKYRAAFRDNDGLHEDIAMYGITVFSELPWSQQWKVSLSALLLGSSRSRVYIWTHRPTTISRHCCISSERRQL